MSDWMLLYDEGAGFGHRRRLQALGTSLERLGITVDLAPLEVPVRVSRVVVDSYRVRADDRRSVDADLTVALDDLRRDLAVDLVVDPSPGSVACAHGTARRVLAGADYAVVDPRVTDLARVAVSESTTQILVSFGGADRDGLAATTAAEVAQSIPDATVLMPIGPWWEGAVPDGVDALQVDDGLAPDLATSDLVVTAGGVTLLESLALGRPTVVVITAENQRIAAEHVASIGAAVLATPDSAARDAVALAADPARRRALSKRATELVDGWGADRVAAEIAALALA